MISAVERQSLASLGLPDSATPDIVLRRQTALALEQASYAAAHSRFYEQRFAGGIAHFDDIPCLEASALERSEELWCLPQRDIARVVTLFTSGSSGPKKRAAFSEGDIARNIAFFRIGMSEIVRPGEQVLCLLPGRAPNGVTDQLRQALQPMNIFFSDSSLLMERNTPMCDCIIGMPQQTLRFLDTCGWLPRSVLLSGDYIPSGIVKRLQRRGIEVFTHYGMTEICYGGAVSCPAQDGCHIRHGELLLEILRPGSLQPAPAGEAGEIVLTTLHHEAMPLLRYRTGDVGVLATTVCGCGGRLPRLSCVCGRISAMRPIGCGSISIHLLDEAIFSPSLAPEILDYRAYLQDGRLKLVIDGPAVDSAALEASVFQLCGTAFPIEVTYKKLEPLLKKRDLLEA